MPPHVVSGGLSPSGQHDSEGNNLVKYKVLAAALLGLSLCAHNSFAEDCKRPERLVAPDGATASVEEMIAGRKTLIRYFENIFQLDECIANSADMSEEEKQQAGEALTQLLQMAAKDYSRSIHAYYNRVK